MKRWSIPILIAIVALLMPVSTASVSAQGELSVSKSADPTSAAVGDTITYTYTIANSENITIENISLVDDIIGPIDLVGQTSLDGGQDITATATYTVVEGDLPGPLVNTAIASGTNPEGNTITATATASVNLTYAASLQLTKVANPSKAAPHKAITYTYTITNNGNVTITNISLQDDKLGAIPLPENTLTPGESITATDNYTVTITDLPGPIVNTATVTGIDPNGTAVSATTGPVSVSLCTNRWELFKAEILKLQGARGKGIFKAPGLQKPFNPKSKASEQHCGKTDNVTQTKTEMLKLNRVEGKGIETAPGLQKPFSPKSQDAEQLRERERVENQGAEQQLQITSEVQNQAGNGQLSKNWGTDNQTGGQEVTGNGHKPDKDKPHNKSNVGK